MSLLYHIFSALNNNLIIFLNSYDIVMTSANPYNFSDDRIDTDYLLATTIGGAGGGSGDGNFTTITVSGMSFLNGGITSTTGTRNLGPTTISTLTGTTGSMSSNFTVDGLASLNGGITSTGGTRNFGATTTAALTSTTGNFSSTLSATGLATLNGGITSTSGTRNFGATTIGAITGTSATYSGTTTTSGLATFNGLTNTTGATTLGITSTGALTSTSGTINGALGVTGVATLNGGITSTSGTRNFGATNIGAITGSSATYSGNVTTNGISTMGISTPMTVNAVGLITSGNTTASSNSSTGSAVFQGGISINNSTEATSKTQGGGMTIAGGFAVAKKAFIGGNASIEGGLNMNSTSITNVLTPSNNNDAANKAYVDSVAQGLVVKDAVRVATTGPGTLATSFENGDTIDGVVLATNDRILIKNQASGVENGIYVVQATGAPTRAADFANGASVKGSFVFVQVGTVNGSSGWTVTNTTGNDIVGTNAIIFSQFSGAAQVEAGTGLTKTVNTLSVNASQTQITQVGTLTGLTVSGSTLLTTLNMSSLTANRPVVTDGSKNLISSTITGTASSPIVLQDTPTIIDTVLKGSAAPDSGVSLASVTDSADTLKLVFIDQTVTLPTGLWSDTNNGLGLYSYGTGPLDFYTTASNTRRMRIANNGDITLGTTTPVTISSLGAFRVDNETDASSSTTGSAIIDGGMGIAKKLYVGTDLSVTGVSTLGNTNSVVVTGTGAVTVPGTVTFPSLTVSKPLALNGSNVLITSPTTGTGSTVVLDSGPLIRDTILRGTGAAQTGSTLVRIEDVFGGNRMNLIDENVGSFLPPGLESGLGFFGLGLYATDNTNGNIGLFTSSSRTRRMNVGPTGTITLGTTNPVTITNNGAASVTTSLTMLNSIGSITAQTRLTSAGTMVNSTTTGNAIVTDLKVMNKRQKTSIYNSNIGASTWVSRSGIASKSWSGICWSPLNSQFVAISLSSSPAVNYSSDGITWLSSGTTSNALWSSICWAPEANRFIAVAISPNGTGTVAMTSNTNDPSGLWIDDTSLNTQGAWTSVCWSSELQIAVAVAASVGIGSNNRVATTDSTGRNWTTRTNPVDNAWNSVCWSPELSLFVAVASSGSGNRVMTSPDGINWTSRTSAADNAWISVCWSPELYLFAAVANNGVSNSIMTSPDGITWTARTAPSTNQWNTICWCPELSVFVALAQGGGVGGWVMTSINGIDWNAYTAASNITWEGIAWSPDLSMFCGVSSTGTNRAMTSKPILPASRSSVLYDYNYVDKQSSGKLTLREPTIENGILKATGSTIATFQSSSAAEHLTISDGSGNRVGISTTQADGMIFDSPGSYVFNVGSQNMLEVQGPGGDIVMSNDVLMTYDLVVSDNNGFGNATVDGNLTCFGTLSKGSGFFDIKHPDPVKREQGYRLRHAFVETNTRGDNFYRYTVTTENLKACIELPDYYKHLNENSQVFISPVDTFGVGRGKVVDDIHVDIDVNTEGTYNVLVIATRKDQLAIDAFEGTGGAEYIKI